MKHSLPLLIVVVVACAAEGVRAQTIDCAQCRAVCNHGKRNSYPDDLSPEREGGAVAHRSPDAEAAFIDGRRKDPGFGGRDLAGAVTGYKRAVLLDGDNSQYRNHLAGALMAQGLLGEAIYNLEHAMRLQPNVPKYLVNLGYAHHRGGDETLALVYYMRALMLDPRDVRARLFAGYALEILGYGKDAALEMRKVLNQDPKNDGARKALLRLEPTRESAGTPPPPLLQ
jgi:tetratricopeptide (TPR) repeat protein